MAWPERGVLLDPDGTGVVARARVVPRVRGSTFWLVVTDVETKSAAGGPPGAGRGLPAAYAAPDAMMALGLVPLAVGDEGVWIDCATVEQVARGCPLDAIREASAAMPESAGGRAWSSGRTCTSKRSPARHGDSGAGGRPAGVCCPALVRGCTGPWDDDERSVGIERTVEGGRPRATPARGAGSQGGSAPPVSGRCCG